jgi:hypothetical protein
MHAVLAINPVYLQWITFIEVPDLIGCDPVPTRILAFRE